MDKTNGNHRNNGPTRPAVRIGRCSAAAAVFAALLVVGCEIPQSAGKTAGGKEAVTPEHQADNRDQAMNQNKFVPEGAWAGDGIRLVVGAKGTAIEYACADGEIAGRLSMDGRGEFTAAGTHKRQRPGPAREGDQGDPSPARFEGKVEKDSMTLKVTLKETNEVIGTFSLKRNAATRLRRCL